MDKRKQEEFISRLQCLFDIATSDALATMKIEEDNQFLIKQRSNVLSCSMSGIDGILTRKEKRTFIRQQRQRNYAEKVASSSNNFSCNVSLTQNKMSKLPIV